MTTRSPASRPGTRPWAAPTSRAAGPPWTRSSRGAGKGGDRAEAATTGPTAVRDSKRPGGAHLSVGAGQWAAFARRAARG
ncbi:DUF397 domain-containing protein [Streptomyces griseoviridis]|uniref:DUF397 domain-containing protein n=1 Tax=Streptomyces griseoviridis TaxID=45398 RepID=A0A918LA53_STRGD|nr:DUF397 domain-containing protein [Streptomyces niveoruber]GGS24046.1 hypothetical protein GCM10010238_10210 [Streptomyces niveoruber]